MYESLDHIRYFLLSAVLLTESVGPGLIVDPDKEAHVFSVASRSSMNR